MEEIDIHIDISTYYIDNIHIVCIFIYIYILEFKAQDPMSFYGCFGTASY